MVPAPPRKSSRLFALRCKPFGHSFQTPELPLFRSISLTDPANCDVIHLSQVAVVYRTFSLRAVCCRRAIGESFPPADIPPFTAKKLFAATPQTKHLRQPVQAATGTDSPKIDCFVSETPHDYEGGTRNDAPS